MDEEQSPSVIARARAAARAQKPFVIKTHTLPRETETQIEDVLGVYLEELDRGILRDSIAYCIRELTANGKKANTKRVYFKEKNLNIEDDNDYKTGMANFKRETLDNIAYWMEKQKAADLYVRVTFHVQGRDLIIKVANNTLITRKEQIRVYDRIARSRASRSIDEAKTAVLDDSEGAGLGIVILVLMLKKLGLDEESFDIDVEGHETVAHLVVPMDQTKVESLSQVSSELANHIESLPRFPENILTLQSILEDPDAEMSTIARVLGQDPSLTADLLRTVNSARFMLPRRMDNVVEAIKIIGLRGLRQMLFSYGTQRVLGDGENNKMTRKMWEHCQRTAFFAYGIGRYVYRRKDILDDVYVGGILHDMGKIVFSSLRPETVEQIQRFSREKGIPSTVFEVMNDGIDHAEVGAQLATQWNFPDVLVETIRHHHTPLKVTAQYRDVVAVVYVANELANLPEDGDDFSHIDNRVFRAIRVKDTDQLKWVHRKLSEQYDREYSRIESQR